LAYVLLEIQETIRTESEPGRIEYLTHEVMGQAVSELDSDERDEVDWDLIRGVDGSARTV
jgi:hypothetical protein